MPDGIVLSKCKTCTKVKALSVPAPPFLMFRIASQPWCQPTLGVLWPLMKERCHAITPRAPLNGNILKYPWGKVGNGPHFAEVYKCTFSPATCCHDNSSRSRLEMCLQNSLQVSLFYFTDGLIASC